jgi:hypothetical protein
MKYCVETMDVYCPVPEAFSVLLRAQNAMAYSLLPALLQPFDAHFLYEILKTQLVYAFLICPVPVRDKDILHIASNASHLEITPNFLVAEEISGCVFEATKNLGSEGARRQNRALFLDIGKLGHFYVFSQLSRCRRGEI